MTARPRADGVRLQQHDDAGAGRGQARRLPQRPLRLRLHPHAVCRRARELGRVQDGYGDVVHGARPPACSHASCSTDQMLRTANLCATLLGARQAGPYQYSYLYSRMRAQGGVYDTKHIGKVLDKRHAGLLPSTTLGELYEHLKVDEPSANHARLLADAAARTQQRCAADALLPDRS